MDLPELSSALSRDPIITVSSDERCLVVASTLEKTARWVAKNLGQREEILAYLEDENDGSFWLRVGDLWTELADSFSYSPGHGSSSSEDSRIDLATSLGKLERNMLAGVKVYQDQAIEHEFQIRRLIFHLTTFTRIEVPKFCTLHAILTQLLSNLISPTSAELGDDEWADKYLRLYSSGSREEDIIIRLLDSQDPRTNLSTLHLINNLTRNSSPRLRLLLSESGIRWLHKLLGRLDTHLDSHDGHFELTAELFNEFINSNLQSELFARLTSPNEPISPSQTTFLKLLDSKINSIHSSNALASSTTSATSSTGNRNGKDKDIDHNTKRSPNNFLIPVFHLLSTYCLLSMKSGKDDARLPKVFEGLVLVSEILSGIGLSVQGQKDRAAAASAGVMLHEDSSDVAVEQGGEEEMVKEMKSGNLNVGIVKPVVELLSQLNQFLPRIKPLRNPPSSSSPTPVSPSSSTLPSIDTPPPTNKDGDGNQELPFTNIKRDLVRLLSVLTFQDKDVGDQVREYGGVQVVLSLCEVDDRNPFLRELALFTVRNLMLNNPDNQRIIGQMDPLGLVGENGELLPLPDKMKKSPSLPKE